MSNTTIPAAAMSSGTSPVDDGDASFMIISTALVYMMTPGLGFFYGGMVDSKNVVNTLYMSFITMAIVTVQWVLFGYSFSFGAGDSWGIFGDFSWAGLTFGKYTEMNPAAQVNSLYSPTYPQWIHAMYQAAFAVITPAIISGGVIGRMKFPAYCIFIFLWSTICYDALAHWLWSASGWLRVLGAIDFAGGNVVHISSGVSAMVAAWYLGPRTNIPEGTTHLASPPYIMLGTGLIWVGWIGFNSGSANAANDQAGLALVTTNVAASSAALTFAILDSIHSVNRHHGLVPACVGAIIGLVVITPAAGYVSPGYGLLMGIIGSAVCFYSCKLKPRTRIDDSLDVFFCHGIGGICGGLLTGFFAEASYSGAVDGAAFGRGVLLGYQLAAILSTIGWSVACTLSILIFLKYTIGIRASVDDELLGMDAASHGEAWMAMIVTETVKTMKKEGLINEETVNRESESTPLDTRSSSKEKNEVNPKNNNGDSPTYESSMVTIHQDQRRDSSEVLGQARIELA